MSPAPSFTRRDGYAVAALFLLTFLLFSRYLLVWPTPLIFPNGAFQYGTDLVRVSWSTLRFNADVVQQAGTLALWRPYLLSGAPLVGHPVGLTLYPANWLTIVLPLPLALDMLLLLHLWWAGVGVYLYLRLGAGLHWEAAFIGALIVAHSPRLFAHIGAGHLEIIEAVAWWPWAWFAYQRTWATRRLRWMALVGIAFAVQALTFGSYLAMSGLWLGICTIWEIWRAKMKRLDTLRFAVIGWGIAFIISVGLAAGELGAILQLLPYTTRTNLSVAEATGGLEPIFLANTIFRSAIVQTESYTFLGLIPIILVLMGMRRPYRERWWAVAAGVTTLLSLGTNLPVSVYPLLLRVIPVFSLFRAPARWWPYTIFALAILAAWGVEKWSGHIPRWLQPLLIALCGVYLILWVFGQGLPFLFFPQALLLPVFTALLMYSSSKMESRPRRMVLALVGLLLIDLWTADLEITIPQSETALITPDRLVTFLKGAVQPGERVFAPYGGLPEASPVADHLYTADGYDPFIIGAYAELLRRADGCDYVAYVVGAPPTRADYFGAKACPTLRPNMAILHLLNIRYVILPAAADMPDSTLVFQDGTRWVYDIGPGMERAFGVSSTQVVSTSECVDRLLTVDPAATTLTDTPTPGGQLAILKREVIPNGEVFTVKADGEGFLVRSEVWTPGWTVQIDDNPVTVQRVDCALQGVAIPAGTHVVKFLYDPLPYEIGWRISLLTVVAMVAVMCAGWRIRKNRT